MPVKAFTPVGFLLGGLCFGQDLLAVLTFFGILSYFFNEAFIFLPFIRLLLL